MVPTLTLFKLFFLESLCKDSFAAPSKPQPLCSKGLRDNLYQTSPLCSFTQRLAKLPPYSPSCCSCSNNNKTIPECPSETAYKLLRRQRPQKREPQLPPSTTGDHPPHVWLLVFGGGSPLPLAQPAPRSRMNVRLQ